jgi:hypothetical protein
MGTLRCEDIAMGCNVVTILVGSGRVVTERCLLNLLKLDHACSWTSHRAAEN